MKWAIFPLAGSAVAVASIILGRGVAEPVYVFLILLEFFLLLPKGGR